jgi:hypothetical protein
MLLRLSVLLLMIINRSVEFSQKDTYIGKAKINYMIALQCGINISLLLGSTTRMPVESTHTPVSSEVCT